MKSISKIPIRNIYYMLCYAWNILAYDDDKLCGKEEFDNIYNLMARILIKYVKRLLKRGFHREYIIEEDSLSSLRGKIDIQQSLSKQTQIRKQLICSYSELSPDVMFNQIIKSTMGILIGYKDLDPSLRLELMKLRLFFTDIEDIRVTSHTFATLHYNRNNQNYMLIINVCRLVTEGLISNENDKESRFADFIRDGQMAKVYEKFVLNFFSLHLPKNEYRVHAPKIKWDLDDQLDETVDYLPELRTDIVLENKNAKKQLIVDTKYYAETLAQGNFGIKKIIHPSNLHQIYTYIGNSLYDGEVIGMLLYPTISTELNVKFPIKGMPILVKTINLADSWDKIETRLMEIASFTQ